VQQDVNSGTSLWRALDRLGIFSLHVIALTRVGEESGRLSENLSALSIQDTKDREFRSKLRSAMMYPVFVIVLMTIIGLGIAWFILPNLAQVFAQMNMKLPLITRVLIWVGTFLGSYGYIAVPAFLVLVVLIVWIFFFARKTKFIGQTLLFVLPGMKKFTREVEIARSTFLLGSLLRAGVPILESLESLSTSTSSQPYQKFFQHVRLSVEEGNTFRKSFSLHDPRGKLIPIPIQQMIVAGEQSGKLSETLLRIGTTFEAKTETSAKNLSVILEPALLVVVWIGVVFVAVAVILPIYSLIGGLNQETSQPQIPATVITNVNTNTDVTLNANASVQSNSATQNQQ
jgi:type IV pilus assembly protein PilC